MSAVLSRRRHDEPRPAERPRSDDPYRLVRYLSVGALLVFAAWVNATNLVGYPISFEDEGAYVSQAWAVAEHGRLTHYPYWYDHPPLGWIVMAGWALLTDGFARTPTAIAIGREVAVIATVISAWLLYILCRRIGMRWGWAAVAVALFALSPLAVHYHRMAFLDNLVTPWVLATFVLMHGKRSLAAYAGAGICFALAVITKLTAAIFLPVILWGLWRTAYPQNRRYAIVLLLGSFALVGFLFPLMAMLRGELLPSPDNTSLYQGLLLQFVEKESSGSIFASASAARLTIDSWLALDHVVVYAGLLATLPALLFRHLRLYAAVIVVHLAVMARGGYLPVAFVVQVLPYLALLVAGVLDGWWNQASQVRHVRGRRGLVRAGAAATLLGASVVLLALPIARDWPSRLGAMHTVNADRGYQAAAPWIMDNVEPWENILVEGQLWVETVRAGRPEPSTVWYFKLGLDPGVREEFPRGHSEFSYIITSAMMNETAGSAPGTPEALQDSYPVERFADGPEFVEIRRIIDADRTGQLAELRRHYRYPSTRNLFGFTEAGPTGETPVAELPMPDEGGRLAWWDGRLWLVDTEAEVRFPVNAGDRSSEADLAEEQALAAAGAESWDGRTDEDAPPDPPAEPDGSEDPRAQLIDDLEPGDRGEDVRDWQAYLRAWDPRALPEWGVDGVFGPETQVWTERYRTAEASP